MRRLVCLSFVVILSAAPALAEPPKSVVLRPKWKKGDKVYIERTSNAEQRYSGGPMAGAGGNSKSVTIVCEEVTAADPDAGATLKFTLERIIQNIRNPQVTTSFDTADGNPDDEETGIGAMLMAAKGRGFSIEIDRNLTAKSVTGMKELVEKMEKASDGGMMTQQLLRNEFNEAVTRTMWADSRMALYANKEVKPGDKWTREYSTETADRGTQTTKIDCTLTKIESREGRDVALIAYTGITKQLGESKPVSGQTVTMKDAAIEGSAVYDIGLGRVVEQRGEASMKINIDVAAGGQKMSIGVDVDRTITIRATEQMPTPRIQAAKKNAKENGGAKDAGDKAGGKKPKSDKSDMDDSDDADSGDSAEKKPPSKPKKADRDDIDDDDGAR